MSVCTRGARISSSRRPTPPDNAAFVAQFATALACNDAHEASIQHLLSDGADPFPVVGGWMKLTDDSGSVFYFRTETGDVQRAPPTSWAGDAAKEEL